MADEEAPRVRKKAPARIGVPPNFLSAPEGAGRVENTDPAPEPSPNSTPIPIPEGVDTALTVEEIGVRRRSPMLRAVRYTGGNAIQVAAWLKGQGRDCSVGFRAAGNPVLRRPDGAELPIGWVLPNLEVISDQDLTGPYERV